MANAAGEDEVTKQAEDEAANAGEIVFVVAFPDAHSPRGFLAGAARLRVPESGSRTISRAVVLD